MSNIDEILERSVKRGRFESENDHEFATRILALTEASAVQDSELGGESGSYSERLLRGVNLNPEVRFKMGAYRDPDEMYEEGKKMIDAAKRKALARRMLILDGLVGVGMQAVAGNTPGAVAQALEVIGRAQELFSE